MEWKLLVELGRTRYSSKGWKDKARERGREMEREEEGWREKLISGTKK